MNPSRPITPLLIALSPLLASPGASFAHEGHGIGASHWHASDLWGFVAIAALAAVAVWQSRK